MNEITLTDAQRMSVADRLRGFADSSTTHEGALRDIAYRLEQGDALRLTPMTAHLIGEAFESVGIHQDFRAPGTPDHLNDVANAVFDARPEGDRAQWWDSALADELREQNETPLIADLADRIRDDSRGVASWKIRESGIGAQVFEFDEHRRLQVWDEADFMGSIDGYSFQEQIWTGSDWIDVTEISTEKDIPPLTVEELLLTRLREFRVEAELTRPESLSPREAALDRMNRSAIGMSAGLMNKIEDLETQLGKTQNDLRLSELENGKVRAALIALAQRISGPAEPRRSEVQDTGPTTSTPSPSAGGPDL